ncbi:MAG: S4 domain-containing protein, partial [Candidatus Omnitrophota bacterium]|nr:S4 domain-containing protein [Candidatus Omnitrophota bacterium]
MALSRAGISSRRKSASVIEEGRVTVNGKVIRERGYAVDPERDEIIADGVKLRRHEKKIYILLNKPR